MESRKNMFALPLAELGKKQVDLLYELQSRGYKTLCQQQLSGYLRGVIQGPQADAVIKLSRIIIDEWRHGMKKAQ